MVGLQSRKEGIASFKGVTKFTNTQNGAMNALIHIRVHVHTL